MSNELDWTKSLGSLSIKSDYSPRASVSYLCGMFRSSLTSDGGVMEIGPLTLTYGCTIQAFLSGNYAGLQCTTMALAAIILNRIYPKWTPKRVNTVLTEGNRLHTILRDAVKLSVHQDGKIAIEDFPHEHFLDLGTVFGRQTAVRLRQECQNVFTSKVEGFEEFLTIKEYLQKWKPYNTNRCGFLITLREASYAIILKKKGTVTLFDSHGSLTLHGELIKEKAGALKFPSIQSLEDFIISMYGIEKQAVIAPVSVSFDCSSFPENRINRKAKDDMQMAYTPYLPDTQIAEEQVGSNTEQVEHISDDPSPFIGMMGGGC